MAMDKPVLWCRGRASEISGAVRGSRQSQMLRTPCRLTVTAGCRHIFLLLQTVAAHVIPAATVVCEASVCSQGDANCCPAGESQSVISFLPISGGTTCPCTLLDLPHGVLSGEPSISSGLYLNITLVSLSMDTP